MAPTCDSVKHEVETVVHDLQRVDRLMTKLEDNNSKLTVLCTEMKAMSEMQTRRMDNMDRDNNRHRLELNDEKVQFNNSVTRIHDKIESSEEKNEKKIDYAIEKLGGKIDDLCDKSGRRIDKLSDRIDKFDKFKWIIIGGALVIGGMFTKFEVLKTLFGF